MFFIILLYALLAVTFILAKNALQYAAPCFLIGFRMITAGLILLTYYFITYKRDRPHSDKNTNQYKSILNQSWRTDIWLFVKTAFFHIYCAFILEFWALQYLSALKTNIIYSSTPFIAALLSYLLLNERLTAKKMGAIILGFCGIIPMLSCTPTRVLFFSEILCISLPECILFCAVISSVYAWFLIKKLMDKGYHIGLINGTSMLIGGLLSLLTSLIFEPVGNTVYNWPLFLWWVSLLIITANILFYNLYAWLLQSYSITFITFAGFLSPLFGMLYERFFMHGTVTWRHGISTLIIAIALYIFYCDELKKNKG